MNKQMFCLICEEMQPKNSFLSHVSEHLKYKQHRCQNCQFQSVTAEEMADHEAATEHFGQVISHKYMDRLCRLVYNDCDYSEKNGLEKVLKRKMVSCVNEEGNGQTSNINRSTPMMAKESAKTSEIPNQTNDGTILAGIGKILSIKEEERISTQESPSTPSTVVEQLPMPNSAIDQNQIGANANNVVGHSSNQFIGIKMEEGVDGIQNGEIPSEFPTANEANFMKQQAMGTSSSSAAGQQIPILQQQMFGNGHGEEKEEMNMDEEDEDDGDVHPAENGDDANANADPQVKTKKIGKNAFTQCLKCGEWVKSTNQCYHINSRHLKLPIYRCLACPRDFYYITNGSNVKNHIRTLHGNDQTQFENNYQTTMKTLHQSRRKFFGKAVRTGSKRGRPNKWQ